MDATLHTIAQAPDALAPTGLAQAVQDFFAEPELAVREGLAGPHNPREFAQKLFACEALYQPSPIPQDDSPEPYSLQWFLNIEKQRHTKQGRWIPKLLEFAKHPSETLLGLGFGLGTDWAQYARHDAKVIVCSPSASQLELVRRNFEVRNLCGRFIHGENSSLPLDSCSIDVACISSLFHAVDNPEAVVAEVFRVLKPGGKVLAVAPARYDVDFWFLTVFWWYRWFGRPQRAPARHESKFSGRQLRRLFDRFIDHRIHKRQLQRAEVPHVWRWAHLGLLSRLMGRVLVLKAFKPVSQLKTI